MDDAIKSSVYVTSPEFAGYLMKKGFRVSCVLFQIVTIVVRDVRCVLFSSVAQSVEEEMGCVTRHGNCLHGQGTNVKKHGRYYYHESTIYRRIGCQGGRS